MWMTRGRSFGRWRGFVSLLPLLLAAMLPLEAPQTVPEGALIQPARPCPHRPAAVEVGLQHDFRGVVDVGIRVQDEAAARGQE